MNFNYDKDLMLEIERVKDRKINHFSGNQHITELMHIVAMIGNKKSFDDFYYNRR